LFAVQPHRTLNGLTLAKLLGNSGIKPFSKLGDKRDTGEIRLPIQATFANSHGAKFASILTNLV
jgi:hypothetical protein